MAIKDFFDKVVLNKPTTYIFIGFFSTIVAFLTSSFLFSRVPHLIGISTILFTVLIAAPFFNKLLAMEEKTGKRLKEKIYIKDFFAKHKTIISFSVYFFVGVFIVLFMISLIAPLRVFSEYDLYNTERPTTEVKAAEETQSMLPPPPFDESTEIMGIFRNNVYVLLISFFLSLFYGAGALFLITLNASIFASALADIIKLNIPHLGIAFTYAFISCNLMIMFFHMIPEVCSYFLAAIAGGILSKAFVREKLFSTGFRNVINDSFIIFFWSVVVLIFAAIIEIRISRALFFANTCINLEYLITFIFTLAIIVFAITEFIKDKKAKQQNK